MASVNELLRLCRLCLVKDEVHIPIFDEQGDIRQIFLKISACLPVKVSREDNLPKNICDSCSSKLESLYQFWNTSANSEKKLIQWLSAERTERNAQHSMIDPVILKQEVVEVPDERTSPDHLDDLNVSNDADYLQQQLPYENVEFQFQQDDYEETVTDSVVEVGSVSRKRRAAAIRAIANMGSEDEGNPDLLEPKLAKIEEESEESGGEDPEPTAFVGLPSATDNDQPGPSGVCKQSADAPIYGEGSIIGRLVYGPSMSVTIVKDEPLRNCSDEETQRNSLDAERVVKREKKKNLDAIHCDMCDKTFRNGLSFGLHSIKHNKKYVCHICEYKTIVRNKFERHIKVHEGKNGYKCESCDKHFAVYIHAVEHKFFHTGEKPFQCHVCGKSFTYSRFLTAHCRSQHCEKGESGKRLYSCTICNKHYVSCTGLTRHKQRYHTVGFDQSKLCDICGKRLASRDQLKFHRRIHTGDKPFSCEVCSKSFTRKDLLREHERVHTGERPYTCQHCNKCFTQRSPLKIHERTHTGERPFVCIMCKKGFIARGILNAHMKKCQGKL